MASLKPPTLVMRLLTSPSSLGPDPPSHGTNENPRPAWTRLKIESTLPADRNRAGAIFISSNAFIWYP